jgi:virulence-associated protein VagC
VHEPAPEELQCYVDGEHSDTSYNPLWDYLERNGIDPNEFIPEHLRMPEDEIDTDDGTDDDTDDDGAQENEHLLKFRRVTQMTGDTIINGLIENILSESERISKETGIRKGEVRDMIVSNLKIKMDFSNFFDLNMRAYYKPEAIEGPTEVIRWINSHVVRFGYAFPMPKEGVEIKEGENRLIIVPNYRKNEHGGWTTTATADYVYKGVKGTVILDEDDDNFWVRKA